MRCEYECGFFGSLDCIIAHEETCPRKDQVLAETLTKSSTSMDLSLIHRTGESSDPSLADALKVFEEEQRSSFRIIL